ncbi:uncharacterized protein C11orf24 homolog [Saccopteryx bilineata]|uniref:uncharacterized protein C11orf24 homolog n=1 Tax=Saccopteryx bilineata TaxID=59482 RepID=UPI00338E4F8E
MWTALVFACISSLSLSASQGPPQGPGSLVLNTTDSLVTKSTSGEANSILNKTLERMTTSSPVTLAEGTVKANHSFPVVAAGRTHRTDVGVSAPAAGPPDRVASRAPTPPSPTSMWTTPTSTGTAPPSLMSTRPTPLSSTPLVQAPSYTVSPRAAPLTTLATSTQMAAATRASASTPMGVQSPATHTPSHSTANPTPAASPRALTTLTQGPAVQALTVPPVADTSGPTQPLVNTASEPTPSSVAPVSTAAVTATQAQAEGPVASTVPAPVPHANPTPRMGATSPTTPPSPVPSPVGTTGPGLPLTPEQVQPETIGSTAPTRPTTGSSGDPKMPTTDAYQLSTQGQYLVVTTKPLPLSSVNRSALLAVLLLGVTLFFTVLVLFALQAYESYKKKDYTQVDYLINGMYADSEM